jgi:hypothetical protein
MTTTEIWTLTRCVAVVVVCQIGDDNGDDDGPVAEPIIYDLWIMVVMLIEITWEMGRGAGCQ